VKAFYEHGSLADVAMLCEAFDSLEPKVFITRDLHRACLIEDVLAVYGNR
jgi:hypothetical protein